MKKFWKENKAIVKYVLLVFVLWQAGVCFLSFVGPFSGVPDKGGYLYTELKVKTPPFFWNWANFDGIHYLDIARKGYGVYQQAFFPFYPKMINIIAPFFDGKYLLAGIFLSNFSFLAALFLFYKLISLDFESLVCRRSLLFFILFPTAFFLGMVYTESFFIMLLLGSFYAARKNHWFLAGVLGGLASYTRLMGIFLFPALLYEWWQAKKIRNFLFLSLIPLGLLKYMNFLGERYKDPLMFLHVQPFFGAERSGGKIVLLYQVFWRYFKMILTTKLDPLYFTVWLEFLVAVGFLLLLYLAYKKRIRISYLIFSVLAFLTPALSGTFSSLPRYVLVLFPCFVYLGGITNEIIRRVLFFIFSLLFVVSTILFFKGYWIS